MTVVSGAVAERMNLSAFFLCSFWMTAFIYAPVAHWAWSSTGWLSAFNKTLFRVGNVGMTDYAGGVVVHVSILDVKLKFQVGGWSVWIGGGYHGGTKGGKVCEWKSGKD